MFISVLLSMTTITWIPFFLFLLCIVAAIKVWWPCQLLSLDFIVQTSNICRVTTVRKRAFHIVAKNMMDMVYEWDNVYCFIWAATWQNQQSECAPSEDSDPPWHPPSLIRVFAVRLKKAWVLSYPLSTQRRLWSSLGAHSLCWFCHVAAHLLFLFRSVIHASVYAQISSRSLYVLSWWCALR